MSDLKDRIDQWTPAWYNTMPPDWKPSTTHVGPMWLEATHRRRGRFRTWLWRLSLRWL